jgi:hypothetical protein
MVAAVAAVALIFQCLSLITNPHFRYPTVPTAAPPLRSSYLALFSLTFLQEKVVRSLDCWFIYQTGSRRLLPVWLTTKITILTMNNNPTIITNNIRRRMLVMRQIIPLTAPATMIILVIGTQSRTRAAMPVPKPTSTLNTTCPKSAYIKTFPQFPLCHISRITLRMGDLPRPGI